MATGHTDSICCVERLVESPLFVTIPFLPHENRGKMACEGVLLGQQAKPSLSDFWSISTTHLSQKDAGRAQKLIKQFKLSGKLLVPENSRKYWIIKSRRGKDSWEKDEMNMYWTTPIMLDIRFFNLTVTLRGRDPLFIERGGRGSKWWRRWTQITERIS